MVIWYLFMISYNMKKNKWWDLTFTFDYSFKSSSSRWFVCVSLNSTMCLCTCFEAVVSSSEVCIWFLSGVKCGAENISCLLTEDYLCYSVLCLSAEVRLYSVAGVLWSPVLMERRRQITERNPANKASRIPFPCLQTVCDPKHLLVCCHDFSCLKKEELDKCMLFPILIWLHDKE